MIGKRVSEFVIFDCTQLESSRLYLFTKVTTTAR